MIIVNKTIIKKHWVGQSFIQFFSKRSSKKPKQTFFQPSIEFVTPKGHSS